MLAIKNFPDFAIENEALASPGAFVLIGVDEVGRGSLAGPVVAGAVFIPRDGKVTWETLGIYDSKGLSEKKRVELSHIIVNEAIWGIGESSVETINNHGIVQATHEAMVAAVNRAKEKLDESQANSSLILVDGLEVPMFDGLDLPHKAIIKGDRKSISIAAASIIAKVYRDNLMTELGVKEEFINYQWKKNKGYGTKIHLEAIAKFGPTALHRRDFLRSG